MSAPNDPTPHEIALFALRNASYQVAGVMDCDHIELWRDARGGTEAAYWRPIWIYIVRTALDIPEKDIAAALTEQMRALGYKSASAPDVHHSTIADMCHRVEDVVDRSPRAAARIEHLAERARDSFFECRAYRTDIMEAWRRHARLRAEERAELLAAKGRGR